MTELLANQMSHPITKFFFGSFVALCLLGSAWGQSTISFTNSAIAGNSFVPLTLNTFDTGLGSLTGVTVTINFVTIQGTFAITTTDDDVTVNGVTATPVIRQSTNTMGFTTVSNSFDITSLTTPQLPEDIGTESTGNFAIAPTNVYGNSSSVISSNFWSAYQSSGPSNVTFQIRGFRNLNIDGDNYLVSATGLTATANMSVTYTYTSAEPIPEPSTVAAGAFLTLVAAASYWRRRRSAR